MMNRTTKNVIGSPIDVVGWDESIFRIAQWARNRESRVVCICNAHSVVTARIDSRFGKVIRGADLSTPDGAPVAWLLRRLGARNQERINGPDLMWRYCEKAHELGTSVYLYGGAPKTLQVLTETLRRSFPELKIAGAYSPPYRNLTEEEKRSIVDAINSSGAGVVWVSLGCPKQEFWMNDHRGLINAVMVGVGAAFDYHAGSINRAPFWMREKGLEWLHRLLSEPRRLWRRYLFTNSLFVIFASGQLLRRIFTR